MVRLKNLQPLSFFSSLNGPSFKAMFTLIGFSTCLASSLLEGVVGCERLVKEKRYMIWDKNKKLIKK